jgi:hypothetical protein
MGLFSWLGPSYEAVKRTLGKVKSGVEGATQLYDKAKNGYAKAKQFAVNLPVVGGLANDLISNGESQAGDYVKKNTGVSLKQIDQGVSTAKKASSYLPSM